MTIQRSTVATIRIDDRDWHAACVRAYDPAQGHTGADHLILVYAAGTAPPKGAFPTLPARPVPVRVHSECLFGDVFGGDRCDCGAQLRAARHQIVARGYGVIVYLRQEGRGIGLYDKVRSLLQDGDTYQRNVAIGAKEDARGYGLAAHVLHHIGVDDVCLLSGNPDKAKALSDAGITVSVDPEIAPPCSAEAASEVMSKLSRGYSYLIRK
ncbi:GTP cyclohydrolase II RibA [Micromonospora sp. NPDC048935]|uniref:GTP cyclohydrolase II RibA n=1 Tax=Micromonospora sp. NPDC048935 TaxID=3364262 RepID=UPI00371D84DA